MKKLLSMLGAFGLVATSSATVVACGKGADVVIEDDTIDLTKTMVVGTRLTIYDKIDQQPAEVQDILDAFNVANNLKLTFNDVKVENNKQVGPLLPPGPDDDPIPVTNGTATITAIDNKVVKGAVNVSYVKKTVDLSTITGDNTKLIVYGDTLLKPDPEDILAVFNLKNNLDLKLSIDVTVDAIAKTDDAHHDYSATISAIQTSKYVAEGKTTNVTITVKDKIDLTTLQKTKLYLIGDASIEPKVEDILTAFNVANNQTFQLSTEVTVEDIQLVEGANAYTATIKAANGSRAASLEIDITIAIDSIDPIDLESDAIIKKLTVDINRYHIIDNDSVLDAFNKSNGINLTATDDVTIELEDSKLEGTITAKDYSNHVMPGSQIKITINS